MKSKRVRRYVVRATVVAAIGLGVVLGSGAAAQAHNGSAQGSGVTMTSLSSEWS